VKRKLHFYALVAAFGFGLVGVVVFQVAFLASVIPHGGIF
jgi:hypothetical protein